MIKKILSKVLEFFKSEEKFDVSEEIYELTQSLKKDKTTTPPD